MSSSSSSTSPKPSNETDSGAKAASQADSAATDSSEAPAGRPSLKCLQDLVADLNTATDVILRSGKRSYSHVTALVACWPDELSDRPHIRQDAKMLCRVLKKKYKFDVEDEPYEMKGEWSHAMFNVELLRCLTKHAPGFIPAQRPEDPTKLFILYYGGHAVEKDGKMVWRPSENAEKQTEVVWTSLLDLFVGFDGDILFLFDCCYAGDMIDYGRVFKRRCEVFCASNKRKKASGKPEHSFTKALAAELAIENDMHGVCEIKRVRSLLNLPTKKDAYNLKVEPFWDRFTRWDDTPICIATLRTGGGNPRPKVSPGIVQKLEALSDARVIFKATFEPGAGLILQEWKEFVHWRPRNLKDIEWYAMRETHFQSLFETNSSSAIISTPMMLWDSMPKRAAYEFICVARSTDMLGDLPQRNQLACSVDEQTTTASHVAAPSSSEPAVELIDAESALRISEEHVAPLFANEQITTASMSSFDAIMASTNSNITGSDNMEDMSQLESLKEFVLDLQKATDIILDSGRQRYDQVTALVTCWPDSLSDRKHIRKSAQNLCDLFKSTYGFDVNEHPYEIPQRGSHPALNKKLLESLDKVARDKPPEKPEDRANLFILYYGGHAVEKDNRMEWRPEQHAEAMTSVRWTSLLDNFTDINCDLLFLFDCCYAGEMVDSGRVFNQRCEVFCASNRDARASGKESHSFTRALVEELRLEAELRRGCEVRRLHSLLNLEYKKKTYKLEVDPYWNTFTRGPRTFICIAPLEDNQANLTTSSSTVQDIAMVKEARVLFKATFKDPNVRPILDEWKEFVNWRPGNIRSIDWVALSEARVHNLFKSN